MIWYSAVRVVPVSGWRLGYLLLMKWVARGVVRPGG